MSQGAAALIPIDSSLSVCLIFGSRLKMFPFGPGPDGSSSRFRLFHIHHTVHSAVSEVGIRITDSYPSPGAFGISNIKRAILCLWY